MSIHIKDVHQIVKDAIILLICLIIGDLAIVGINSWRTNNSHQRHIAMIQKGLPKSMTKSVPIKNQHFHPTTVPTDIQGCYVSNVPIKYPNINKYFQITSIVRLAPHDIFQQFVLSNRKVSKKSVPIKTPKTIAGKTQQVNHIHQMIKRRTPANIMSEIYQRNLNNQVQDYNIDMQPGNMSQHGSNSFNFKLKQQTMVAGYNTASLKNIIGVPSAIIIPPVAYSHLSVYADKNSNNLSLNGRQFKRISKIHTIKLMKQADVHPYFLNL